MNLSPPAPPASKRRRPIFAACLAGASLLVIAGATVAARQSARIHIGKQPDGSFLVSTQQRIEPGAIAFPGRPIDMALSPEGAVLAVLNHRKVLFISRTGTLSVNLDAGAGFRGVVWHPSGKRLFVSTAGGFVQELDLTGEMWRRGSRLYPRPLNTGGNPRPGGMAITADGSRLYVAATDRNAVAEFDTTNNHWLREFPVQNLPFTIALTPDEKRLIVSNWGGREVRDDDDTGKTGNAVIVVDAHGAASSGTVSIINRETTEVKTVPVGLHPTDIAFDGDLAYIANAASDSLSELSVGKQRVLRTLPIRWGGMKLFGSMPCALAIRNHIAYICAGGDNALCIMDLTHGSVLGFRPAGYFPVAVSITKTGSRAYVLNTKGNGSVLRTSRNLPGNVHDFQGTVSVIDLNSDIHAATNRVAQDAGWNRDRLSLNPKLAVYRGAIQHVLYIIKENRTYDEVLGDMPEGNGDAKLCDLGENITPNHHALARQFSLLDNAYVTGTNSADGHQWCTQALANDYIEHFYTGYRTYPNNGDCAMAISGAGCLWDAALKKGLSFRDYGEYCDGTLTAFSPAAKTWSDLWKDRASGKNVIRSTVTTRLNSLRPYINPNLCYWPLIMSDQKRADIFIDEYTRLSKRHVVPTLMMLTLPCDHTQGRDPHFPTPQSMVADNDLALGRVVEAVSKSPEWKSTCIFVIEDDAQFGPDHVDGHRTTCFVLSPFTRRKSVDHELCSTLSLLHSVELMLRIPPMNRFDALTPPFADCFTDTPDYSVYTAIPNRIPLDQMNPPIRALSGVEKLWTERSLALDWSGPDHADPHVLNEVIWHTLHGTEADTPYPAF